MKIAYNQYVHVKRGKLALHLPMECGAVVLNDTNNPGSFGWMAVPHRPDILHRTVGSDYVLYACANGDWWYCVGDSAQHVVDGTGTNLADAQRKCERGVLLAVLSCLEFLES